MVRIKRVYEPANPADGVRILVDRLWPRGVSKQRSALDLWLKDVAPSDELRKWFGHDPERWKEFQARYRRELKSSKPAAEALRLLREKARQHTVTLLYGARDQAHNEAQVLQALLARRKI
ncbi:MAG TPA: DUF488 domain-containing protein [Phycisphaerae bacterium]|nr:DUF488 domain-containing protein [Phycisphaerae bacterium]